MVNKISVSPGFCYLAALWMLVLPPRWGLGALLAALVHELLHCLAVWISGGQVLGLTLGPSGARIETLPMAAWKEALCALAGPVGSFSVVLLAEYFPEAALFGLVQGLYNLLPVYPLDGGRILRCLLPWEICAGVEVFALVFGSGLCLWAASALPEFGSFCLICLWIPVIRRKISCKEVK